MRINVYSQELTNDDDRSAVTFWLPKSKDRRRQLAQAFRDMAALLEEAPPETGLD